MGQADNGERVDGLAGKVEQLNENISIAGWAVDLNDPGRVLTVELWAGGALLAETETGEPRNDVAESLNVSAAPGYRFATECRDAIRDAAKRNLTGELTVRVRGYDRPLDLLAPLRTLEIVRLSGSGRSAADRLALVDRLSHQMTAASGAFGQPLRPSPARSIGFVESIAIDDAGFMWVTGWMNDDLAVDRPIVILDNAKFAGGMAFTFAPRPDLPAGAHAFIGILLTEWRPSIQSRPYFFLTDGSGRYLDCLTPTPIRPKADIAQVIRPVLDGAVSGYPTFLREMFLTVDTWVPTSSDLSSDLLAVDEVAIMPGFGAFVMGWALSPTKECVALMLKVVDKITVASQQTMTWRPRDDLATIYPGADRAISRAGYVAVFRGEFDLHRAHTVTLKAVWNDGTSTNVAIGPDRMRVLGGTAPLDRVSLYYPAVHAEPFFADFAYHAATEAKRRAASVTTFAADAMQAAVILVAPAVRAEISLMFERARLNARHLAEGMGIVILARANQDRAVVINLFHELRVDISRPCALMFVSENNIGCYGIDPVIAELEIEYFTFVSEWVLLTEIGWAAAGRVEADSDTIKSDADEGEAGVDVSGSRSADKITVFEIVDPTRDASTGKAIGLNAFSCPVAAWRQLADRLPAILGGWATAPLPADVDVEILRGGAFALGELSEPAFVARINEVIVKSHG
ncbi:hypothetical protein [Sphingomonas faeni]|uniref:hypothetical protein n=1 Tax=Sphingomonas faeni TaxID=185950 RepID=UPI003351091C